MSREPLDDWLKVRISRRQLNYLHEQAGRAGMGLAEFVRSRLTNDASLHSRLDQLQLAIEVGDPTDKDPQLHAVQIEALLLLRRIVSAADHRSVQADLKRFGLAQWNGIGS